MKRKERIRFKLHKVSSLERLRLCVFKSCRHVSAQIINRNGNVLHEVSSSLKTSPVHMASKLEKAQWVAAEIAKKAEKNVSFFFDRGAHAYHGIVKVFAEMARECGMRF